MPSPVNPPERPSDIPSDPNAIMAHNLQNIIKLVRTCVKENAMVPEFILKMYMVWWTSTLEQLVSKETITPIESFNEFKKMHREQMNIVSRYIEDVFLKTELRESLKQAEEKK